MKTYFTSKSGPNSWAIYTSSTGGYLRVSGFYHSKEAADLAKWKRFGGIRPNQNSTDYKKPNRKIHLEEVNQ